MPDGEGVLDDVVAGAVTGWLPFGGALEPLVRRMSVAVRHEHARRHSIAMKAAERRSCMSREDVEERIASDPDLVPIAVRVLYAAGSTGDEKLLKLLGAALGDAANQASEEGALIVGVLESLRPSHIAVLETLGGEPPPAPDVEGAGGRWWLPELSTASGLSDLVVSLCVSELASRGVIQMGQTYRGDDCALTALGQTMLDVMHDLTKEGPPK